MPNFSSITVMGHLGRDAETKEVNGDTVVSFSLATTRKRGDNESTTWWRCQFWGKRAAKVAQYLTKGKAVCVVGECYTREYEAKDKSLKVSLEVDVRELVLLGGGERGEPQRDETAPPPRRPADASRDDDEIPF